MPVSRPLAELIETARHAIRKAGRQPDPSVAVGHAAWALGEIAARIERDGEILTTVQAVHAALDAMLAKANHGLAVISGLDAEEADALAAVDRLEAALNHARPNAATIALSLDG